MVNLNAHLEQLNSVLDRWKSSSNFTSQNHLIQIAQQKIADLLKFPSDGSKKELENSIQKIVDVIGKDVEIVSLMSSILPNPAKRPKVSFELVICSDLIVPDHNGAISEHLLNAVEKLRLVIASRELMRGDGISPEIKNQHIARLKTFEGAYRFFQRGELFLLIPKILMPYTNPLKSFKVLDFNADGSLVPSTLNDALSKPEGQPTLEDLKGMFSTAPYLEKMIWMAGHGSSQTVCGMDEKTYKELLSFFDRQKCCALTLHTCSGGGASSMFSIPLESEEPHRFPIIVHSIGDYKVTSQPCERNLGDYFKKLSLFIENETPTLHNLRKVVKTYQKDFTNLTKVYFPHAKGSPGGFRPLDETGESFTITYVLAKGRQITGQKIEVYNKQFLNILPLSITAPLVFHRGDPILLSMVPDQAEHFIHTIELSNKSPQEYLKSFFDLHKSHTPSLRKKFTILRLQKGDDVIGPVYIYLNKDFIEMHGSSVLVHYGFQGKYYKDCGKGAQEIPEWRLLWDEKGNMIWGYHVSEESIRVSSGGQESI